MIRGALGLLLLLCGCELRAPTRETEAGVSPAPETCVPYAHSRRSEDDTLIWECGVCRMSWSGSLECGQR